MIHQICIEKIRLQYSNTIQARDKPTVSNKNACILTIDCLHLTDIGDNIKGGRRYMRVTRTRGTMNSRLSGAVSNEVSAHAIEKIVQREEYVHGENAGDRAGLSSQAWEGEALALCQASISSFEH